jgi:hypothetical protein
MVRFLQRGYGAAYVTAFDLRMEPSKSSFGRSDYSAEIDEERIVVRWREHAGLRQFSFDRMGSQLQVSRTADAGR